LCEPHHRCRRATRPCAARAAQRRRTRRDVPAGQELGPLY